MSMIDVAARVLARRRLRALRRLAADPAGVQMRVFRTLIQRASRTDFGRDHGFERIASHEDFKRAVPLGRYQERERYFDRAPRASRPPDRVVAMGASSYASNQ